MNSVNRERRQTSSMLSCMSSDEPSIPLTPARVAQQRAASAAVAEAELIRLFLHLAADVAHVHQRVSAAVSTQHATESRLRTVVVAGAQSQHGVILAPAAKTGPENEQRGARDHQRPQNRDPERRDPARDPDGKASEREHQITGVLQGRPETDQRQRTDQAQPPRDVVADRQHGDRRHGTAQRQGLDEAALERQPLIGGAIDPGQRSRQHERQHQGRQRDVPADADITSPHG